jgi:hypothetical protein
VAARTCTFRVGRARPTPCQPARRIGCILKRLILLTGGNELKLAEVFARAELKRGSCGTGALVSDIGGLGKWARNIAGCAARCGRALLQDVGFHPTFSFAIALLFSGVARLTL